MLQCGEKKTICCSLGSKRTLLPRPQLNINRYEAEHHCRMYESRFCMIIDDTWSCRELDVNTKYTVCKDLEHQITSVYIYIIIFYTYIFSITMLVSWNHKLIALDYLNCRQIIHIFAPQVSRVFGFRVPPSPCAMSGKMVGRSCLEEETEVFNRCLRRVTKSSYPQLHFVYIHDCSMNFNGKNGSTKWAKTPGWEAPNDFLLVCLWKILHLLEATCVKVWESTRWCNGCFDGFGAISRWIYI